MVAAMKTKVGNPLRKLVLIKLADNANDQGECWPSHQYIADQCEISKASVKNHIRALADAGFLQVEHRDGPKGNTSNLYHITLGVGQELTQGGAGDDLGGGAGADPRTSHSLEPVNEPLFVEAKASASSSEQSSGMTFVLKDGSTWECPNDFYAECIERFSKTGTDQQFEQAAFWLTSNPCKRKTARGMKRFLGAWLQRWHEKSCKNGLTSSYTRKPEIHTRQDAAPIETEASAEARNAVMDLRSSL